MGSTVSVLRLLDLPGPWRRSASCSVHRREGLRGYLLGSLPTLFARGQPPELTVGQEQNGRPRDAAERRQVTVMFSDLVGSTALSARWTRKMCARSFGVSKCVAETVRRFDGFVAKYMGDGVLIYFGYPQAHEDDAERAVRAGLELVSAVVLQDHTGCRCKRGLGSRRAWWWWAT